MKTIYCCDQEKNLIATEVDYHLKTVCPYSIGHMGTVCIFIEVGQLLAAEGRGCFEKWPGLRKQTKSI